MANPEQKSNYQKDPVVENVALFLAGRIKREELTDHNKWVLDYYLDLMNEDSEFKKMVDDRKNVIMTKGRRIPLFSSEELRNTVAHKKSKKNKKTSIELQPSLWPKKEVDFELDLSVSQDSNQKLYKLQKYVEGKHQRKDNGSLIVNSPAYSPIVDEVRYKKSQLRKMIGLPVARGKDSYINDRFYKFLVRKICHQDIFGIFVKYDRVLSDIPSELESEIAEVKNLVEELLNRGLNERQKFNKFSSFFQDHNNEAQ